LPPRPANRRPNSPRFARAQGFRPVARRQDFDHNNRVRDFDRLEVGRPRGNDERIRLESGARADRHRHPIRKYAARQAGALDGRVQRFLGRELGQGMVRKFRRHYHRPPVAQLPSSLPSLGPPNEGVDTEVSLRRVRRGVILAPISASREVQRNWGQLPQFASSHEGGSRRVALRRDGERHHFVAVLLTSISSECRDCPLPVAKALSVAADVAEPAPRPAGSGRWAQRR
jgi:hypothetical protein